MYVACFLRIQTHLSGYVPGSMRAIAQKINIRSFTQYNIREIRGFIFTKCAQCHRL